MCDVVVRFTGLCTFFPLGRHWSEGPEGALVLLANGGGPDAFEPEQIPPSRVRNGIYRLHPHVAFMRFDLRDLKVGLPPGLEGLDGRVVWPLRRERIHLDTGATAPFAAVWDTGPDEDMKSLRHLIELQDLLGSDLTAPDPSFKGDSVSSTICSWVELRNCRLEVSKIDLNALWKFETYDGREIVRPVAHELSATFEGRETLIVSTSPFPDETHRAFEITLAAVGRNVELVIANLCSNNNVLGWPRCAQKSEDDLDFEWHYQVLHPRTAIPEIRRRYGNSGPPVHRVPAAMGGGVNCFPAGGGTGGGRAASSSDKVSCSG